MRMAFCFKCSVRHDATLRVFFVVLPSTICHPDRYVQEKTRIHFLGSLWFIYNYSLHNWIMVMSQSCILSQEYPWSNSYCVTQKNPCYYRNYCEHNHYIYLCTSIVHIYPDPIHQDISLGYIEEVCYQQKDLGLFTNVVGEDFEIFVKAEQQSNEVYSKIGSKFVPPPCWRQFRSCCCW